MCQLGEVFWHVILEVKVILFSDYLNHGERGENAKNESTQEVENMIRQEYLKDELIELLSSICLDIRC